MEEKKNEDMKPDASKKILDKIESNFTQAGGLLLQVQWNQGIINASNKKIDELRKESGELIRLLSPEAKAEIPKSE